MKPSAGTFWSGAVTAGTLVLATLAASAQSMNPPGPAVKAESPAVKRGEYMVKSMGCWDCHTPHRMGEEGPEPDMTRWLSGHPASTELPAPPEPKGLWVAAVSESTTAWAGPWGISYTANLTPDPETGLGGWTEQQFIDALRTGRHQGRGRQILPPMPWRAISNLTDDDLKAVFAYLRAIPPVKNKVPDPVVAPPPAQE